MSALAGSQACIQTGKISTPPEPSANVIRRSETEKQIKGYSGQVYRGYTLAEEGYKQAKADFDAHKRRTHSVGSSSQHKDNTGSVNTVGLSSLYNAQAAVKQSRPLQPTENLPPKKKLRREGPISSSQNPPKAGQPQNGIHEKGFLNTQATPARRASIISLSSDDEQESSGGRCWGPQSPTADHTSLPTPEGEDVPKSMSPELAFNDELSSVCQELGFQLCQEQLDLVYLIKSGQNVFYTGSAGCGKSTVLKCFVRPLRALGKTVHILAPTGRAAIEVNGSTLWSYAGWRPETKERSMKQVLGGYKGKTKRELRKRLSKTDILVIDEISMIENFSFERLNRVLKHVKDSDQPFGGIQVVISGDFCQLPPVQPMTYCVECGQELVSNPRSADKRICSEHGEFDIKDSWAFRSHAWRECNFTHVWLREIHRQKDKMFVEILEKVRWGKDLSKQEKDLLENHPSQTEGAVRLFSRRDKVAKINEEEFTKLSTPIFEYPCHDNFERNPKHHDLSALDQHDRNADSHPALDQDPLAMKLRLRVGMRVLLQVNLDVDEGLINGSLGEIVRFDSAPTEGRLSKSTGGHADYRESRIRQFIGGVQPREWPVVRFFDSGREKTIFPQCRVSEKGTEKPWSLLSRTQIPLMAAWAMTIHKAQGMTLPRVCVDLANTFENGHGYVALSRATGFEGLRVENLKYLNGGVAERVRVFHKEELGVAC